MTNIENISLRQLKITAMTFMAVFLLLAAACWYWSGHWCFMFAPAILIYFIEYGCRVYKKDYWPPFIRRIYKYCIKFYRNREYSPIVAPECPADIAAPKLLSSISEWLVKDMDQCLFFNNFSSIGTGTPEQIQEAFGKLLVQYYDASKNEYAFARERLRGQIDAIEAQWLLVNTLASMMIEQLYSLTESAMALRYLEEFLTIAAKPWSKPTKMAEINTLEEKVRKFLG